MKRPHRKAHRALWPALALAVLFGFAMALMLRPPAEPVSPPAQEQRR